MLKIFSFCLMILIIGAACIIFSTQAYIAGVGQHQFSIQAQSFLHGRTDIPKTTDTISMNGKYYWHQNPFPSFVLIPGQLLFGLSFNETFGILFLLPILSYFLYKLARLKKFANIDCIYFVFAFLFASVMINLITHPNSWYFAQVVATTILTVLLYEFETRRNYLVIGVLEGILILTRPFAGTIGILILGILILDIYKNNINKKNLNNLFYFLFPVILSILSLLYFNYIRFHLVFVNTYQLSDNGAIFNSVKKFGVFSIQHIISNFYYYFLASVTPVTAETPHLVFPFITYSPYGLSFLIVSPFFIYSIKTLKTASLLIKQYWAIIGITLSFLFCFYGLAGYITYGPRYTADFLPILYIMLLNALKPPHLTKPQITIILASSLLNIYLLWTMAS